MIMKKISLVCLLFLWIAGSGNWALTRASEPVLTIRYEESAQFELISAEGQRVLIDVFDPSALSSPPTKDDILLTSHAHDDHYKVDFVSSFPGQQIFSCTGEIKRDGVYARGLASAHMPADPLRDKGGTNYIFIIEIDGLRIAHFGAIGQEKLNPYQLEALGRVDIALMQLANSYSDMDDFNMKAFNLMDQIHPKIVIPTHFDLNTAKVGAKVWQARYWDEPELKISREKLPAATQLIFMGKQARTYAKICKAPKANY